MKLHLSVPINLLSFPRKEICIQENFFVNFHLISLPQKLYHNFSSAYLFLEKRCTIYDTHISFWNRSFTKCRSMNCKLDKVSKNIQQHFVLNKMLDKTSYYIFYTLKRVMSRKVQSRKTEIQKSHKNTLLLSLDTFRQ